MNDTQLAGINTYKKTRNLYFVMSYVCNARCDFCLFVKKMDETKDINDVYYVSKMLDVFLKYREEPLSINITGGEPFMNPDRLMSILTCIYDARSLYDLKIKSINLSTNGTFDMPDFMREFTDIPMQMFISRHSFDDEYKDLKLTPSFSKSTKILAEDIALDRNAIHIRKAMSCTLIKGAVDTIDKLKKYLDKASSIGYKKVVFRELTKLKPDDPFYSFEHINYYEDYVEKNKVSLTNYADEDDDFEKMDYKKDLNILTDFHYGYKDVHVVFQCADESKMDEEWVTLWPTGKVEVG